jgi:hypothetical protein
MRWLGIGINRLQRATGGAPPAFTPASLFTASEAGFWANVTPSRLWQDVARTTPVTAAGQPVGSWQLTTASGVIYAEQSTAGSRPTYQVDTGVGYLDFDGTDDCLVITSLNLTATNKMTVIASVQKDTDASLGVIVEHSVGAFGVDGSFVVIAGGTGAPAAEYGALVRGTGFTTIDTAPSFPAVIKNYVTMQTDIGGPLISISASGSVPATTAGGLGIGNFATHNFFIGARNQSSLFFNGRIYGLIVRGALTSGANLTNAEAWADDLINP